MLEENGKLMRITRETMGYSYAQVEEITKVRELYLEHLESGDLSPMPGRIYAIGFADTYARFLGMDPEPILADVKAYYDNNAPKPSFEAFVSGKKVVQAMAEGAPYDPTLHEVKNRAQSRLQDQNTKAAGANSLRASAYANGSLGRPIRTRNKLFGRRFLWVLLGSVIVLLLLALYLLQDNVFLPGQNEPGQVIGGNVDVNAPIVLQITATDEQVWVGVRVDMADQSLHATIQPGESVTFTAQRTMYVRFSGATHAELDYNGTKISNFSAGDDIYNMDFTPSEYSGYDDAHRP